MKLLLQEKMGEEDGRRTELSVDVAEQDWSNTAR